MEFHFAQHKWKSVFHRIEYKGSQERTVNTATLSNEEVGMMYFTAELSRERGL